MGTHTHTHTHKHTHTQTDTQWLVFYVVWCMVMSFYKHSVLHACHNCARWKHRKFVSNFKSCPRAEMLDSRVTYMMIHSYRHVLCSSALTSNSSCLQPWNSNSLWTLADWRVELQTGLLTSEALQKCPFTYTNYEGKIDGQSGCFLLFWSRFFFAVQKRWSLYGWQLRLWRIGEGQLRFGIVLVSGWLRSGLVWSHWVRMELVRGLWLEC